MSKCPHCGEEIPPSTLHIERIDLDLIYDDESYDRFAVDSLPQPNKFGRGICKPPLFVTVIPQRINNADKVHQSQRKAQR